MQLHLPTNHTFIQTSWLLISFYTPLLKGVGLMLTLLQNIPSWKDPQETLSPTAVSTQNHPYVCEHCPDASWTPSSSVPWALPWGCYSSARPPSDEEPFPKSQLHLPWHSVMPLPLTLSNIYYILQHVYWRYASDLQQRLSNGQRISIGLTKGQQEERFLRLKS